MTDNELFQIEKKQIDDLIDKGYIMIHSKGSFDGDWVEFENIQTSDIQTLLLTNQDSRKYFTTLYMKQHGKKRIKIQ